MYPSSLSGVANSCGVIWPSHVAVSPAVGPCSSGCPISPIILAIVGIRKLGMENCERSVTLEFTDSGSSTRRRLMMKWEMIINWMLKRETNRPPSEQDTAEARTWYWNTTWHRYWPKRAKSSCELNSRWTIARGGLYRPQYYWEVGQCLEVIECCYIGIDLSDLKYIVHLMLTRSICCLCIRENPAQATKNMLTISQHRSTDSGLHTELDSFSMMMKRLLPGYSNYNRICSSHRDPWGYCN